MLASGTMFVASVFTLFDSLRPSPESRADSVSSADDAGFLQSVLPPRLLIMLLLITGYLIAMPQFGFLLSSGAFLFLSFSYLWRKPWFISLAITLISVVVVYLVFRQLFQVVLPHGVLLQGWF